MNKKDIFNIMDENESNYNDMAKKIWQNPETAMNEKYASKLQSDFLIAEGFDVTYNIGNIETAFVAEYGEGKPIIGILGEFDALPGLSQKITIEKMPIVKDGPGHGCGHNLLGTAGVKAAVTILKWIKDEKIKGTIRYYGCPAEETLNGKVIMAKYGTFNDLDAALTWHPMNVTGVWRASALAMNSMKFKFYGKAAHAAAQPDAGRSALDAVELMNVGANYLREHVIDQARIHYTITNGGVAPNIVPSKAESWYYVRAPKRYQVEEIVERLYRIADGAAMMTDTKVEKETIAGCYDFLSNDVLSDLFYKNMMKVGNINNSEEDLNFAKQLQDTVDQTQKLNTLKGQCAPENLKNEVIHQGIIEDLGSNSTVAGSTDVGDVSWIVPTAQFLTAAWPIGIAAHSWQSTVASGSDMGINAMNFAAKVLTGTCIDIFLNPQEIVSLAKKEFCEKTIDMKYISPLK